MIMHIPDEWPDDADGQVLRKLRANGLDFSRQYVIDFMVDFEEWPPNPQALARIRQEFATVAEYVDDVSGRGSVIVKIEAQISYRFVVDTQQKLTDLASDFGGWCDSWGVLH